MADQATTRGPRPGDRITVNLPGTVHHGRTGTLLSVGPYAHCVALDISCNDSYVFRDEELDYPDDAPDDPAEPHLKALRDYADGWAANASQDLAHLAPSMVAVHVALGEIARLRAELGYPAGEDED